MHVAYGVFLVLPCCVVQCVISKILSKESCVCLCIPISEASWIVSSSLFWIRRITLVVMLNTLFNDS